MSDSDCWMRYNEKNIFFCKHHNAKILKSTCDNMRIHASNCNYNDILNSNIKCLFCNGYQEQYLDYNRIADVICNISEIIPDINF